MQNFYSSKKIGVAKLSPSKDSDKIFDINFSYHFSLISPRSTSKMIRCEFKVNSQTKLYTCEIRDEEIPSEVNSESFEGDHQGDLTNDDVKYVFIQFSRFTSFPKNLGAVFKNVTWLRIWYSNLREITKEDLKQFPNLKILNLLSNQIENIPKDLFEFNKKLKFIGLSSLKVQKIESSLLAGLPDLEEFSMNSNQLEFIPGDFFKFNRKIKKIYFQNNKLKFIGPELLDGLEEINYIAFNDNPCINMNYDKSLGHNIENLKEIRDKIKSLEIPPELCDVIKSSKAQN